VVEVHESGVVLKQKLNPFWIKGVRIRIGA